MMWKIRAAILCAFIGISVAVGSNSTLLDSKISAYRKTVSSNAYNVITTSQFKFIMSVGSLHAPTLEIFHKCFTLMISAWHGVTSAYCVHHGYDSRIVDKTFEYYIILNREGIVTKLDVISIRNSKAIIGQPEHFTLLTLTKPVPTPEENEVYNLADADFPIFREVKKFQVESVIGWNKIERKDTDMKMRGFLEVSVALVNHPTCTELSEVGLFCIKLIDDGMKITKDDFGGPVMYRNTVVGIIIHIENDFIVAANECSDGNLLGALSNSVKSLPMD